MDLSPGKFSLSLVLCLCLMLSAAAPVHAESLPSELRVVQVDGSAEVKSDTADTWSAVEEGERLDEGDEIRTGREGNVQLGVPRLSYFELPARGRMQVRNLNLPDTVPDELGDAAGVISASYDFQLLRGSLLNFMRPHDKVRTQYQLETVSAIGGVRGTTFECAVVDENATRCAVLEGELEFGPADGTDGQITLSARQSSRLSEGDEGPPPVGSLGREQLRRLQQFRRKALFWTSEEPRVLAWSFSEPQFHRATTIEGILDQHQSLTSSIGDYPHAGYVDHSIAEEAWDELTTIVVVVTTDFSGKLILSRSYFDRLRPIILENGGTITPTPDGYRVEF